MKSYLVSQGILADEIQTRAEGKPEELSKQEVSTLSCALNTEVIDGMR